MTQRILFSFFVLALLLASCQQIKDKLSGKTEVEEVVDTTKAEIVSLQEIKKPLEKKKPIFVVNEKATATANYVAGITEEPYFEKMVEKDFYKKHKEVVEKAWEQIHKSNLLPIKSWVRENKISTPADTLTMIYPFSGPDFLYANAFFPYCKNYILIGLEKMGSLPSLKDVNDDLLKAYLEGVRHSLRYINKKGYFVTTQMQKDLNQQKLDGTIHILLYYLARTQHKILNIEEFILDEFGKPIVMETGKTVPAKVGGLKIRFKHPKRDYAQDMYYFSFNLADENVKKRSEFLYFVNSFGPKVFYTKSASYILHDSKFSTIRKLLLDQSKKILQDDTGIPYFLLDNGNYRITLYGDYTRTINDFEKNYQPRLKEALNARKEDLFLPFKIGYNAWFNETVLIYGESITKEEKMKLLAERTKWRKKQQQKKVVSAKPSVVGGMDDKLKKSKGILFRVQFLYSDQKFEAGHPIFNGLTNVGFYTDGGKMRYTIGNAVKLEDLAPFKAMAKSKGFKDAFVVAFKDGKRISVSEAQELTK